MRLIAKKPCSYGGKKFFIGDEIPAELVVNIEREEKLGVISIANDEAGVPEQSGALYSQEQVDKMMADAVANASKGFTQEQVDEMIRLGQRTYAAAPALPVTDTVKVADMAGLVQSTPDRKTLYAVQTPQVFQANILKAALQSAIQAGADITDDCSAVERLGKEVWLAPGWRENIKITTREDLTMAEAFLRERENRA